MNPNKEIAHGNEEGSETAKGKETGQGEENEGSEATGRRRVSTILRNAPARLSGASGGREPTDILEESRSRKASRRHVNLLSWPLQETRAFTSLRGGISGPAATI